MSVHTDNNNHSTDTVTDVTVKMVSVRGSRVLVSCSVYIVMFIAAAVLFTYTPFNNTTTYSVTTAATTTTTTTSQSQQSQPQHRHLTANIATIYSQHNGKPWICDTSDGCTVGNYSNKQCSKLCRPYGGALSIVGVMSGQCDCKVNTYMTYKLLPKTTTTTNGSTHTHYNKTNWQVYSVCVGGDKTCCGTFDTRFGVMLYTVVTLYMFLALAIICDNYFCEALEVISEKLHLSTDVAGATFMAAGSSAPELFTAIVTVLITGGSEGLGTIVGSAVFNMMVIVGVVAVSCGQILPISWYPLSRDCIVYVGSVGLMLTVMWDRQVMWWEALILVLCYGGYIMLMKYNKTVAAWAKRRFASVSPSDSPSRAVAVKKAAGGIMGVVPTTSPDSPRLSQSNSFHSANGEPTTDRDHHMNPLLRPAFRSCHHKETAVARASQRLEVAMSLGTYVQVRRAEGKLRSFLSDKKRSRSNSSDSVDLEHPAEHNRLIVRLLSWPLVTLFRYTVPCCTSPGWEKYYMVTFMMSIVWIGIASMVMVDFASRAGCFVGIPGIVMGLIIIAAGTSVPDALSSVLVARNGQGDMAVANVLGSNVFNILLGLGCPWLIKALASPDMRVTLPASEVCYRCYRRIYIRYDSNNLFFRMSLRPVWS